MDYTNWDQMIFFTDQNMTSPAFKIFFFNANLLLELQKFFADQSMSYQALKIFSFDANLFEKL